MGGTGPARGTARWTPPRPPPRPGVPARTRLAVAGAWASPIVALAAAIAAKDARKKDPPDLVGEWAAETSVEDGKLVNRPPGITWSFTADGNSVLAVGGGAGSTESTYKADPARNPAEVDVAAGPKGRPLRGIYKVDGDTLTLCLVAGDRDRPTKFEAPAGSNAIL